MKNIPLTLKSARKLKTGDRLICITSGIYKNFNIIHGSIYLFERLTPSHRIVLQGQSCEWFLHRFAVKHKMKVG